MTTKPRFTLKAVLGCTAVVCVALTLLSCSGIFGHGEFGGFLGSMLMLPVVCGCLEFLFRQWGGSCVGVGIGVVIAGLTVYLASSWALVIGAWMVGLLTVALLWFD